LVALGEGRPLFAFAGLWTPWRGVRGPKSARVEGEHELFGFLTTEANAIVTPIHPKAMPVILTTLAEVDRLLVAHLARSAYGRLLAVPPVHSAHLERVLWVEQTRSPSRR
jgi:putative SOS response-associated peptidase YedK